MDPTCKLMKSADFALLEGPRNGRVTFENGMDFPGFPPNNPRFKCNSRKVPSKRLIYTSTPGFVGADEFVIETVDIFGIVKRGRFQITVR